jgi:hypothetical protein
MIPVVLGIIASSIGGGTPPIYSSYTVTTDCAGSSPYDVYTEYGLTIIIGRTIFSDPELTTRLVETSFIYNNKTYSTDSNGDITTALFCYNSFTIYDDCDNANPSTVYTLYDSVPEIGTLLYTDPELTSLLTNVALFIYNNSRFRTNGGGEILAPSSGPAVCPTAYTIYNDCAQTTSDTVYSESTTFEVGMTLYIDDNLSTPYSGSFIYGSTIYTATSGVVDYSGDCPSSFIIYDDCAGSNFNTVWSESGTLEPGITLYTDANLGTYYVGSFVYNNNLYTASSEGIVSSSEGVCSREWTTYDTCNNARDGGGNTSYYTAYADATLQVGVTLYIDNQLTTAATVGQIVYTGMVYILSSGEIQSAESCIYSIPYTTSGCGSTNDNTLYTPSSEISNEGLQSSSAVLYSDIGLSNEIVNATLFRYGYNTYITTNGSGTVDTVYSCPT